MGINKIYVNAQDLLAASYQLAAQVAESGFRPNFIVGIWRGGAPVGIAVQEALDYCSIATDHIAIRTSSYTGIAEQAGEVAVFGLNFLIDNVNADDSVLILDDVFDSGRSIDAVIRELKLKTRANMPNDLRVGTVYYKPNKNLTDRVPDFYVTKTEDWLIFPHELKGLTPDEIRARKPFPESLLKLAESVSEPT